MFQSRLLATSVSLAPQFLRRTNMSQYLKIFHVNIVTYRILMKSCFYDNKLTQFELHMQSFRRGRHNLATMRSVYTLLTTYKHFVFGFCLLEFSLAKDQSSIVLVCSCI